MKLIQDNPKNASAIIIYDNKKILLQERDSIKNIFYPNYYGLFGGALKIKENFTSCIIREVKEELNIDLIKNNVRYFFDIDINFPINLKKYVKVKRKFYCYKVNSLSLLKKSIKLKEGKSFKILPLKKNKIDAAKIIPYDRLAIDIFIEKVFQTK